MIDFRRLEEVLDAYGASPERWPEEERGSLLALTEENAEARAMCDEAARLDTWLDHASAIPAPSADLVEKILPGSSQSTRESFGSPWIPLMPIAAAALIALWAASGSDVRKSASGVVMAEDPGRFAPAEIGVYATPTDVLLSVDGLDPLAYVPDYGCEDEGLGCIELDVASAGARS